MSSARWIDLASAADARHEAMARILSRLGKPDILMAKRLDGCRG